MNDNEGSTLKQEENSSPERSSKTAHLMKKKGVAIDKSILGEDQIIAAPRVCEAPLQGTGSTTKANLDGGQLPRAMRERLGVHGLDLPKYEERRKVEEGRIEGRKDIAAQGR
jgi:hypothetical protein